MLRKILLLLLAGIMVNACSVDNTETQEGDKTATTVAYVKLRPEEAKAMMDEENDYLILDVRTTSEYQVSRIRTAYLLPVDEISNRAETEIPDKNTIIFVYCRSGNRSRTAALALIDLGFTRVYDIGGIVDWPYDIAND